MRTDQIETVLIKKMREEKSNSKFWGGSQEERKSCNTDRKIDLYGKAMDTAPQRSSE